MELAAGRGHGRRHEGDKENRIPKRHETLHELGDNLLDIFIGREKGDLTAFIKKVHVGKSAHCEGGAGHQENEYAAHQHGAV